MTISKQEFESRLANTRMDPKGKTAKACKVHLVDGKTMSEAAEAVGVNNGVITRGVKRIMSAVISKTHKCPKCGHEFEG